MARILVADDDVSVRVAIRKALVAAGHTVDEAGDGQAVLDQCRRNPPDVLLIDLYMPGMDGLETIIRLRGHPPSMQIVAMSGGGFRNKHDVLTMAIRAGAVGTLAKPFALPDLLAAVSHAPGAAEARPRRPSGDAPARVLLVDDDAQARDVLRQRLALAGYTVVDAPDAERALDRFRAGPPVDAVITDVILPGQSGADLIAALRAEAPAVGIIAISGAPERLIPLRERWAEGATFRTLPKPFTTEQLLEALDAVLPATPRPTPSGSWLQRVLGVRRHAMRRPRR